MTSTDILTLIDANAHRLSPLLYRKLKDVGESMARAETELRLIQQEIAELRKELEEV